jgi:hypothetical protein
VEDIDTIRPCDRPENIIRKQRSRITNGRKLLLGVDGRSPFARRYKDNFQNYISDFGGEENCSVADLWKAHNAAVLKTELEFRFETKFFNGVASDNDFDLYQRGSGNLRRILESPTVEIGLKTSPHFQIISPRKRALSHERRPQKINQW